MISHRPFVKSVLSFLLSTAGHLINIFIIFPFLVGEDGMGRNNTQEPDALAALTFSAFTILILTGGWFLLSILLVRRAKLPIFPCVISLLLIIIGGYFGLRFL